MFDRELTSSERVVATYYGVANFVMGVCVGVMLIAGFQAVCGRHFYPHQTSAPSKTNAR